MGFEHRPLKIIEAIQSADTQHLSRAGAKGAEVTNARLKRERERQEIHELQSEIEIERRKLQDTEAQLAANEHIISPDGIDHDY
jgi:N-methylhydantoinase B/oxoprolinase/acetone carboxylase alpha subunit